MAAALTLVGTAAAQTDAEPGFALNRFEPSPAGDPFFGVPSPAAPGHLDPRVYAAFDYAHWPVRLRDQDVAVVSSQAFLRLDASLSLWDRLLVSADMPFAVALAGEDPGVQSVVFTDLEAPQLGDLRLGARFRAYGENTEPFQIGIGSYLMLPTGDEEYYAGDGSVRGDFHASLGGRVGTSVAFIWNAAGGIQLRAADSPHAVTYGAGAGILFADDVVQLGAEFYGQSALGGELSLSSTPVQVTSAGTNAELLFGGKVRLLGGLTIGAAAGPGLGTNVGTPIARVVGLVGWAPLPGPDFDADQGDDKPAGDRDDDGITDDIDACPDEPGEPSADPAKDGCPPPDRDGDGILDVEDACPTTPGLRNMEPSRHGCPEDSDGDGVHDGIDRCPQKPGMLSEDPKHNGCPSDRDGDGVFDTEDSCRDAAGEPNDDALRNGCPEDPDGDGIKWADDACPNTRGEAQADPKKNGCPTHSPGIAPPSENEVGHHVLFRVSKWSHEDLVTPLTNKLAAQIREAVGQPGVAYIEIQGHTDDSGEDRLNDQVALKRAETVRDWLVAKGLPGDKLKTKGYSWTRPVADNRVRQGRLKNRRVQFVVIKK